MDGGFVKVPSEIIHSSIWNEAATTRIVWITFLARSDKNGFVHGNNQVMIRLSNVTKEEFDIAIKILESPDPESSSPEHDGRRLEKVDGGWNVLNYKKYREMEYGEYRKSYIKNKVREHRKNKKEPEVVETPVVDEQPEVVETTPTIEKVEEVKITPENWRRDQKISITGTIDEYIQRVNDWIQASPDSYSDELIERFSELPPEQIKKEIIKSINWLKDNPEKRKPCYHRFLMNWLQRTSDSKRSY